MGLDIRIKGLDRDKTYHGPYSSFFRFRRELCKAFYDEEMFRIYRKIQEESCPFANQVDEVTVAEREYWNNHCNDDFDTFLLHSDCDGKLTNKECRKIYEAIKDVTTEDEDFMRVLNLWKDMLLYCAKTRRHLFFE